MDTRALFKIGYGLYVLTANDGDKDNGCIINTVMQVTSDPCQIAIAVNKRNFTCGMVQRPENLIFLCFLNRLSLMFLSISDTIPEEILTSLQSFMRQKELRMEFCT